MTSIIEQPGRPADLASTLAALPAGVRMNLGWRDPVGDAKNGLLMGRIGSGRTVRKLIIKLTPADLYDIEIGRMNRRTLEWIVEGQTTGLYADQLAEAALRLHGEVTS